MTLLLANHSEELLILTRVCRIVRKYQGVEANTEGAKKIADLAFALYSSGMNEEEMLIQKLRQQA